MKREKPTVIDGQFTVVGEAPPREPIIKSWPGLWWFIGTPAAIMAVRYAQIRGWL